MGGLVSLALSAQFTLVPPEIFIHQGPGADTNTEHKYLDFVAGPAHTAPYKLHPVSHCFHSIRSSPPFYYIFLVSNANFVTTF